MTPYELTLAVKIYNEKQKQEHEEKLSLAYFTAYWQRVEKLPSYNKVFNKTQQPVNKKKEMDSKSMFEMAKQLNAAFGGTVH
jgi:hypothetical protein